MAHATEVAEPRGADLESRWGAALPRAWAALALAAVGVAGSLFLSLGLGLRACPLCFYQRTFVMAAFAVLGVGLVADRARAGLLCLVSLPLAFGGLGVAGFHEYLVLAGKLECPGGLLGLGTAPAQSVTVLVILTAVVAAGAWAGRHDLRSRSAATVLGAGVLGLLLAWGSVASAPPMSPRTTPYDAEKEPFNICRPRYQPA
jgi:disulfide bond formation protein DsbB